MREGGEGGVMGERFGSDLPILNEAPLAHTISLPHCRACTDAVQPCGD